jgi:hypothetical protein
MVRDIELFSNQTMKKASELIDNTETGSDFKAIIDDVDRLSILAKINDRHALIQQNNQSDVAVAMLKLADRLPN